MMTCKHTGHATAFNPACERCRNEFRENLEPVLLEHVKAMRVIARLDATQSMLAKGEIDESTAKWLLSWP